ncbi:hypothetical protein ACM66B_001511 [Microbotryomycetes sp. NB124-2]
MSNEDPPPSIFGTDDDPRRDSALRPWQWLPFTLLVVLAILFVSLRRSQALELYDRARVAIYERLPFLRRDSAYVSLAPTDTAALHRRRPPRRGRRNSDFNGDEDDDDDASYTDSDLDPTSPSATDRFARSPFEDEFPSTDYVSPAKRITSAGEKVKSGVQTLMQTLGWDGRAHTAFRDGRDDGIARAFWGVRPMRRAGTIKLGEGASQDMTRTSSEGGETDGTLFDLEANDAQARELPSDFKLSS